MSRIAIITGASSGMGRRFAQTAAIHVAFDELWVIARRADRLEALSQELAGQTVRRIPMDLTDGEAMERFTRTLAAENPEIVLLVNAAGFGKFQAVEDIPCKTADSMLALNCSALMDMCYICLPYMKAGSRVLNIASVAAFQPVPYITEYAATKAFVLYFSRGLWKELRPKGITVTALCPYWTKTEFFNVAYTRTEKDRVTYLNAMYDPVDVVDRGWRDLLKGRDLSTFGFIARIQILLVTILPHRLVMKVWCGQQRKMSIERRWSILFPASESDIEFV
jgi:short-subunit dehydrogenase